LFCKEELDYASVIMNRPPDAYKQRMALIGRVSVVSSGLGFFLYTVSVYLPQSWLCDFFSCWHILGRPTARSKTLSFTRELSFFSFLSVHRAQHEQRIWMTIECIPKVRS